MTTERIQEYLKLKNISIYAFENAIGSSRGAIAKAVKEKKSIGSGVLENILRVYPDINAQWILTGEGEMIRHPNKSTPEQTFSLRTDRAVDNQCIPLYDLEAVAGIVSLFSDSSRITPIDYISIPNVPNCDGAIHVVGDSMYPLLKSGDIVLYKEVKDIKHGIFWGEMYLISFNLDGEEYITIKYIQKSEEKDYIRLVSHNPDHQSKDIPVNMIMALAMVKASIRFNALR